MYDHVLGRCCGRCQPILDVIQEPPRWLVGHALFWILFVGFLARAQTFREPVFDHHNWRQADTAQIARNFWRERFNPLFPQIDQRGDQEHGYVETGLELYAFAFASVAKLTGFYFEIGRLLNCVLFVASGLIVFRILRRRHDAAAALIGVFTYAFGLPLSLFLDRAIMNEPLLMFLSFASLASAQSYLARRTRLSAAVLVVATALLGMIKFPYLIIWAPVFGLFLEREGLHARREWLLYAMMTTDLASAALWYSHAHRLGQTTGLTFGLLDKTFDAALVLSSDFYVQIAGRIIKDVLGPIATAAALVGLIVSVRRRLWPEILGMLAFVTYVILVARGNSAHDYYQVAIVPTAVMLITIGITGGIRVLNVAQHRQPAAISFVLAAILLSTVVRSLSFHSWYEYDPDRAQLCRELKPQLAQHELVAFLDYPSPDVLLCLDRRGWLFAPDAWNAESVLRIWQKGAAVVVVPAPALPIEIPERLRQHAVQIAHAGSLAAYRMKAFSTDY